VGPLARGVDDLALALEALAGYDPADPASVDRTAPDYLTVLSPATPPLTVGAPTSWFDDVLAGEVRTAWRTTLDRLGESGVAVRDVELPDLSTVGSIWLRLVASDSFAWHQATLASDPDGYTPAARGLFERGRTVTAVEVARAREERQALLVAMLDAMEGVDALILPTSAVPAPLTAEIATGQVTSDGRLISAANIGPTFMMPFNVTGQPALTVPVALSTERLPIAVQVVGRPFQEVTVLEVGKEVAAVMPVDLRPPLA
jgi:aspartyl-tRNA(Asn)/glutamyl-tRNA(Gln) amidotransferase subunit A